MFRLQANSPKPRHHLRLLPFSPAPFVPLRLGATGGEGLGAAAPSRGSSGPWGPLGAAGTCPGVERKIRFGCHLPSRERKILSSKTPFSSSPSVTGVGFLVPPRFPAKQGIFHRHQSTTRWFCQDGHRAPCTCPCASLFWKVAVTVSDRAGRWGLLPPSCLPYTLWGAGGLGDIHRAGGPKTLLPE